ncbi:MAG: hypothetical protein VB084_07360 [Syntrophomonadaceae bacterium]|nr:hypothetical protein [Syntrophomonadaceae bacterium]
MQNQSPNKKCRTCMHFGYCKVYWGIHCKRQGGAKIPKLKTIYEETRLMAAKPDERPKPQRSKKTEILDPIRTKAVNW